MIHIQPNMDILYYFMIHISELAVIQSRQVMCIASSLSPSSGEP